ncbi:MAG: type II toxin-antitoxin system HicA family toxin [Thermoplasmata archaeon]
MVVAALRALGFRENRQKGSQLVMQRTDGIVIVVPLRAGEDIARGLLRKIIREASVEIDEFLELV